jgi:hypothetical protein
MIRLSMIEETARELVNTHAKASRVGSDGTNVGGNVLISSSGFSAVLSVQYRGKAANSA